ncbi:MAG: undecaprenyl/decaprenyl-phosphate alpha-N-acetylglucosaminyl 1-phosphate transferase [bacterium]|nr:undecaprenyl/decaprenyl-phosphate alpha-N-acetylglucosaminyl 1-phosphate transferase [bacterium]
MLVPLVTRLAVALKAVDRPGDRRNHSGDVARLGGLAIGAGFLFGTGSVGLTAWPEWNRPLDQHDLLALMLATGMVFLLGIVDDVMGVSALKKLLVQTVAAWFIVASGWQFEVVGLPFGFDIYLGPLSGVLTVLWIVGVTNAINLIDGLDGLAAGVVGIIASSLLVFSIIQQSPFAMVLTAGIVGSCLGFLPHNWDPARIFMGDSGSQPLGFLLATLSVYSSLKSSTTIAILVPLLALGVPIIDTLLVMAVRFLERPKGPLGIRLLRMFAADTYHLHHLLALVTTRRGVVNWIYLMVSISCVMAVTVAVTKQEGLGLVLVAVELVAIFLVRRLGLARQARGLARRQREGLEGIAVSSCENAR